MEGDAHEPVLFHFLVQGNAADAEGIGGARPAVTGIDQGSLNARAFSDFATRMLYGSAQGHPLPVGSDGPPFASTGPPA